MVDLQKSVLAILAMVAFSAGWLVKGFAQQKFRFTRDYLLQPRESGCVFR
jgi:hypothetical protein